MPAFLDSVVVLVVVAASLNYSVVHAVLPPDFEIHLKTCAEIHYVNQKDMVRSLINPGAYPDFGCAWACILKNVKLVHTAKVPKICIQDFIALTNGHLYIYDTFDHYNAVDQYNKEAYYKKLDSQGKYDVDAAIKNIEKLAINGVEVNSAVETVKKCAYVNNEPVSDGVNGCERSTLLIKCIVNDILPKS